MNRKTSFEKKIFESRFFREAKSKAEKISDNPESLNDLIDKADKKAREKGRSVLGESWGALMTFFRMLKAYTSGKYRKIPWKTLVAIVGAVVYFVMPFDFIPDFILGFGFADDVTLILWTMKFFKSDIESFAQWEKDNDSELNIGICSQD